MGTNRAADMVVEALRAAVPGARAAWRDLSWRDRIALVIAVVCLVLGAVVWATLPFDPGLSFGDLDGKVVVAGVDPSGLAASWGIRAGDVVVDQNGVPVVPGGAGDPRYGKPVPPIFLSEPNPDFADQDVVLDLDWRVEARQFAAGWQDLGLAILVLVGGSLWLWRERAPGPLRRFAVPLSAATAGPLGLAPLIASSQPAAGQLATLLAIAAMLPLASGVAGLVPRPQWRALATTLVWVLAGFSYYAGPTVAAVPELSLDRSWQGLRTAAIVVVPVLLALVATGRRTRPTILASAGAERPGATAPEWAVVAITPAAALGVLYVDVLGVFVGWMVLLLIARPLSIRPLQRLVTRTRLQRDVVVAAMEAERSRLAADLHDDALQELTLLSRRLDAGGDAESAAMARHVADRLRAICGDLRLPILDDLGTGAALEWLVERVEHLAGGSVSLELGDPVRPPAHVELAFFRVAQEALSNAVQHGRPPIRVTYRTSAGGASLAIDDDGPGIADGAADEAPAGGHFGLLNMQQRAEQIGAILDIRRWPRGGTHVALEWRAR